MLRTMSIATVLTTFTIVTGTSAVFAETPEKSGRAGATFGIGLGGGTIGCADDGCDDFNGAGSLSLHAGAMLGDKFALLGDLWWMLHEDDALSVNQGMLTGALRVWPVRMLWFQAGVGVARLGVSYDPDGPISIESRSEWVPAFNVGVGVEPISTDSFGLDVHFKYGTGFYSDGDDRIHNVSLNLGLSFY